MAIRPRETIGLWDGSPSLTEETGVHNTYELLAFPGLSWLVLLLFLGSSLSLLHTQC